MSLIWYKKIATPNQHGIIELAINSHLQEQQGKQTIWIKCETVVFKTLDIRQGRIRPCGMETSTVSSTVDPAVAWRQLKAVSGSCPGRMGTGWASNLPELRWRN
jgi:hypothetical protein